MKYEKIIDLLREVEKSGVEEFELEKENFRIRMKKIIRKQPGTGGGSTAGYLGLWFRQKDRRCRSVYPGGNDHKISSCRGVPCSRKPGRRDIRNPGKPCGGRAGAWSNRGYETDERCSIRMCGDDLGNISEG